MMEKMEEKMEAAEWEEVDKESSSGYLAGEEPTTLEEEFSINQMKYESDKERRNR